MSNEPRHGPVNMDKAIERDLLKRVDAQPTPPKGVPDTVHEGDSPRASGPAGNAAARTGDGGTPARGDAEREAREDMREAHEDRGGPAAASGKTGKASGPGNQGDRNNAGSA